MTATTDQYTKSGTETTNAKVTNDPEINKLDNQFIEYADIQTNLENTLFDAMEETEIEHGMSFFKGLKLYHKAVFWSVMVSLAIIMEGYDTILLGNFYAYPTFLQKYGIYKNGQYVLETKWQQALSMSTNIGLFFGVLGAGYLSDKYGEKKIMLTSYVVVCGFIFITFFSNSPGVLFVGEFLCGLPWGCMAAIAPAYASEVCPVVLRGHLTNYINLCFVIGQVIAAGILKGLVGRTDEWGFRIPFAIQWAWPVPLFIIMALAPESPWSLVRRRKFEEAEKSLRRLVSDTSDDSIKRNLAFMIHTTEIERKVSEGVTYMDLFKGSDLRRTEIACAVFIIQQLSVGNVLSYGDQFFETAGFSSAKAFDLGLAQNAIGFFGTLATWFIIPYIGRRAIYLFGLTMLVIFFEILGFVSLANNNAGLWAQAGLVFVLQFLWESAICPIAWMLIAEMGSIRLRTKTVAISRCCYLVSGILSAVIYPYMMSPDSGNWKGKVGFLQGGIAFLCLVWTYFRLPEIKGRTYAEIDILFQKGVPTRQFKRYVIDLASEVVEEPEEVMVGEKVQSGSEAKVTS